MAAKQVLEILSLIQQVHQDLAKSAELFKAGEYEDFCRYTLEYIERHEKDMEHVLELTRGEGREDILNTYIRYYPIETERAILELLQTAKPQTPQAYFELLVRVKEQILHLYDGCRTGGQVLPAMSQLFEQLKTRESAELTLYGRRLAELHQGQ